MPFTTAGARRQASFAGIYAFLACVIMFFGALTSAMVVRRGSAQDWQGVPAPRLLWVNTAILGLSSIAVEKARRDLRSGDRHRFTIGWSIGTALGGAFAVGQGMVWKQLVEEGVYINSHPGSAFFYVGTVSHAVHLAGGWLWLLYLAVCAFRLELGPGRRTGVDVAAIYWHFLGVLWVYLLWLLIYWGN